MKVSYDILKKFVTPPEDYAGKDLAHLLTMSTVEVEDYADMAEALEQVVVGVVEAVKPHPNADKLKLAVINVGSQKFEVVCGGVNLREGMKVAFAHVGARVRWHGQGDWVRLTKATIRGVDSNGMACAAEELGLDDPKAVAHGIMDLSYLKAVPGTPLAEALGQSDIILDIDNKSITHRPDLWGHLGLARELAALWSTKLHEPKAPALKPEIDVPLMVTVQAPAKVVRYMAVAVGGLKVESSPLWLQQTLQKLGVRPINNIVDVTNYVMLELGQPLHAFDLDRLASPDIVIRQAKPGEKFTTLDGVERTLNGSMLLIADRTHAQAIAGVMGGQRSEVSATIKNIVLESATFEAINIRTTAAALALRTEASARFEKALDPNLAELGLRRAVALLVELCPGAKVTSPVVDVYNDPPGPKPIALSLPWLTERMGLELDAKTVTDILERLGFKVKAKGQELAVTPPSWRATRDITIPEDLVEEVARIYGYNKIPLVLPAFAVTPPTVDVAQQLRWKIRDLLVGAGWTETLSYSFAGNRQAAEFGYEAKDCLELVNPVDQAKRYLRPSVAATFYEQFEAGRRANEGKSLKLFELGRVFSVKTGKWSSGGLVGSKLPHQPWHLALGAFQPSGDARRVVKGVLDLLEQMVGVKLQMVCQKIVAAGIVTEIELEDVQASHQAREFKPIPKYPSVERDLSIIFPPGVTWAAIAKHVRSTSPLIESIEVFDVYAEKGSIAFHLTFRSEERTLKSAEVDEVMAKVTSTLRDKFGITVRT